MLAMCRAVPFCVWKKKVCCIRFMYQRKAEGGRRYYDNYDIAKINHVEHFKEMGMTTEEIQMY